MAVRTITTRLAIDGESQYKQAVTNINSQLKTLKSELALVESKFKGQANSMEALRAKNETLAKSYDAQRSKVEALRAALDNAKSAQQSHAQQVEELRGKLDAARQAMDALGSRTGENAAEYDCLQAEIAQLSAELDTASAKYEAAGKGVNSWQSQLNYAERDLNNLDAELAENAKYLAEAEQSADGCTQSIDEYGKEVKDAGEASGEFGNASKGAVDALAQALVAAGLADKVKEVAQALYSCVDTFGAFQAQMSTVQAISGATAEEMSALGEKAKYMGATTAFTAEEAGQALEYMAMAGWKTDDMLGGLDGIMNLAAASGENLASVSDIVTDALTAFGLSASESARFADVLAAASSNSNTSVALMGETFQYAAPVAGALGYSVEDTALAIGLMANAGIKGSAAGTSLRGTLTNLAKPSKTVAGYMERLGVSLTDNDGRMRSLADLIGLLRTRFAELTEAEQAEYAAGLAGKEAMSGLLAIVNASESDFQKLTAAINDCSGAALEMSQVRLDNYYGQVTLLESAVDGLKLTVGSQLAPIMERLASGATTVVNGVNEIAEACPGLSAVLAGVTASAGVLATAFAGFSILQTITPAIKAFNVALAANPAGAAAVAIVGVVTALGTLAAYFADASEGAGGLNRELREIEGAYKKTEEETLATAAAADKLIDRLAELEAQENLTEGEAALYAQTVEQLRTLLPDLNIEINEQTGLLNGGAEALRANTAAWKENAIAQAMQEKYQSVLSAQADALVAAAEKQLDYNDALATCTGLEKDMLAVQEEMQRVEQDASMSADERAARINELTQKMGLLSDQYLLAKDNLSYHTSELERAQAKVAEFDEAIARLTEAGNLLASSNEGNGATMQDLQTYVESVRASIADLEAQYTEVALQAAESVQAQFDLWTELDEVTAKSVESMINSMQQQELYWEDYSDNLDNLKNRNIEGLDELVASIADGSQESAAAIAGMAQATDDDLARMVEKYGDLESAQDDATLAIANTAVDYEGSMNKMQQIAIEAIQKMDISDDMKQNGIDMILGLESGMDSRTDYLYTKAVTIANNVSSIVKKAFDINSPSRVFRDIGSNVIEGFRIGIDDQQQALLRQMANTAGAAMRSFESQADIDVDAVRRQIAQAEAQFALAGQQLDQLPAAAAQQPPNIVMNFTLNGVTVREEADIDRIAQELYFMAANAARSRGGHL